jgi:hypothetical protein
MPKKPRQNNHIASRTTAGSRPPGTRHIPGIGELLARAPLMRARAAQTAEQQPFFDWLRAALPAETANHVLGMERRSQELILRVDSAAWCNRIRYALAALQPEIQQREPLIGQVLVRVAPPLRRPSPPAA